MTITVVHANSGMLKSMLMITLNILTQAQDELSLNRYVRGPTSYILYYYFIILPGIYQILVCTEFIYYTFKLPICNKVSVWVMYLL